MNAVQKAIYIGRVAVLMNILKVNADGISDGSTHSAHDWSVDRKMIESEPERPFIHVAYEMGTHMFPVPSLIKTDPHTKYPFQFGEASAAEVLEQYIAMFAKDTAFDQYERVLQSYDGDRIRVLKTAADAAEFLKQYRI